MALTKRTDVEMLITVNGHVRVQRQTVILEDGAVLTTLAPNVQTYAPGADVTAEVASVKAIAAAAWTPEVLKAHTDAQQAAQDAAKLHGD